MIQYIVERLFAALCILIPLAFLALAGCASLNYARVHKMSASAVLQVDNIVESGFKEFIKRDRANIEKCYQLSSELEIDICRGKYPELQAKAGPALAKYQEVRSAYLGIAKECRPGHGPKLKEAECIVKMQAKFFDLLTVAKNLAKKSNNVKLLEKLKGM